MPTEKYVFGFDKNRRGKTLHIGKLVRPTPSSRALLQQLPESPVPEFQKELRVVLEDVDSAKKI